MADYTDYIDLHDTVCNAVNAASQPTMSFGDPVIDIRDWFTVFDVMVINSLLRDTISHT